MIGTARAGALDSLLAPAVWSAIVVGAVVAMISALAIAWASALGATLLYIKLSAASARGRSLALAIAPVAIGIAGPFGYLWLVAG